MNLFIVAFAAASEGSDYGHLGNTVRNPDWEKAGIKSFYIIAWIPKRSKQTVKTMLTAQRYATC